MKILTQEEFFALPEMTVEEVRALGHVWEFSRDRDAFFWRCKCGAALPAGDVLANMKLRRGCGCMLCQPCPLVVTT